MNLPALREKEKMLFTDSDNELTIATVDPQGNPVDTEVEISFIQNHIQMVVGI